MKLRNGFIWISLLLLTTLSGQAEPTPYNSANLAQQNLLPQGPNIYVERLSQVLPIYEAAAENPWETLPDNVVLKKGSKNKYVLILRDRLLKTHDLSEENNTGGETFDTALKEAVAHFQTRYNLKPDGVVGKNTRDALNVSADLRLRQLKLNYERLSQIPDLDKYVLVNTADFNLNVIEDDESVLRLKVIVGKPKNATPIISSHINTVVFNPYWNVPNSIARKEIIPSLIRNPNYLDKHNMKVLRTWGDKADVVPHRSINWYDAKNNGFKYRFRQEPGDHNALGRVKFSFDNTHSVYMHDTPTKSLFNQTQRTFSHGCIRVERPMELAEYILQDDEWFDYGWLYDTLQSKKIKYIPVKQPLPVYITYVTAWADENGVVQFREDVYERDDYFQADERPWLSNNEAPTNNQVVVYEDE